MLHSSLETASFVCICLFFSRVIQCFELEEEIKTTEIRSENALNIHFRTGPLNFTSYQLEVYEKLLQGNCTDFVGEPYWKATVKSSDFVVHDFYGLYRNGLHCVKVTPMSRDGQCHLPCKPVFKMIEMNGVNCQEWNETTYFKNMYSDGTYQVEITVKISRPFEHCFPTINISMWNKNGSTKNCYGKSENKEEWISKVVVHANQTAVFRDLKPGNYCVWVEVSHQDCSGVCQHGTTTLTLEDLTSVVQNLMPLTSKTQVESTTWLYALFSVAVIVSAIVGFSVFTRKKLRHRFAIISTKIEKKDLTLEDLRSIAEKRAKELQFIVLYCRDFDEHTSVVNALYHFIFHGFGFVNIRIDLNEEARISIDDDSWVKDVTEAKPNRKFIIVESEGAIIQENQRKDLKAVRPVNEDFLDDIFPTALRYLHETQGHCDYKTIFVVKFLYTPENIRLKFFSPNRRFKLPDHLFDLYCALLELPTTSVEVLEKYKNEMSKKWEDFFCQDLIASINTASQMLHLNPNHVRESFVERDSKTFV